MMQVSFPGGVAVGATFKNHTVITDQPAPIGADTAMSPFDLFLASIATCMGFYALRFCQQRDLSTEGLDLTLNQIRDPEKKLVARIEVGVKAPNGFPERYRKALVRAIEQCAVKRHLHDPPEFEVVLAENA